MQNDIISTMYTGNPTPESFTSIDILLSMSATAKAILIANQILNLLIFLLNETMLSAFS